MLLKNPGPYLPKLRYAARMHRLFALRVGVPQDDGISVLRGAEEPTLPMLPSGPW